MATIIGTPSFFDLGETTTPGAQTITVPSDATHVALFVVMSDSGTPSGVAVSSVSSTFAGTFTINNSTSTSTSMGGSICTAEVTSTGADKTFTPVLAAASTFAGAGCWCVFLKYVGVTWPTDFAFAHASGAGTTPGTASASGLSGGLAIALDTRVDTTSAQYPANETGWDAGNTAQRGPGTGGYYCATRLRTLALSSTATVDATTQTTLANVLCLLTVGDSSPQTLTPSLTTNSQTFHAPTIGRGAVTLVPALVTNGQTFFASTVSAIYSLSSGLVTNSQVFYGPIVAAGAVTLLPDLATNTQTFYGPTVALGSGAQELLPSLAVNTQTFYGATLTANYALAPTLFTNTQVFLAPSVSAQYTLLLEALVNTSIFYAATVSPGAVTLQPALVTNTQAFYGPVVTQQANVELLPGLVTNDQIFYPPTVELAAQQTPHYTVGWSGPQYERKSRKQREEERRKLGILPEEPVVVEVPVSLAETKALSGENRAVAERVARQLLERFAPKVTIPVAAVALPAPDEQPTIGPVELPMEVQATLVAAQKKRAFEQDLVYIVATLIS